MTIVVPMIPTELAWLLGHADPALGIGWNPRASRAARWRLGRTRALLRLMGDPDRTMRVVLIAGTKGKGSTAAFLASILHAGGVRAGLFSSPHLQTYRERVRIDGRMLRDTELARAIRRLRPAVAALRRAHPAAGEPTAFELTLALAMRAFAERGCRVAVVEVGLGGRLDATNALDPAISILAPVSHDHSAILGRSLATIAEEKAGIVRRGRPALVAEQRPAAMRAIRRVCREAGAELAVIAPIGRHIALGLSGDHQRRNAALAAAAARLLELPDTAIAAGLRDAAWPGRYERVPGRPAVILDGAHNDASADALARTLRRERARPIVLVVGLNRDKDALAVLRPLGAIGARIVATRSASARARDAGELAGIAAHVTRRPSEAVPDVAAALAAARAQAGRSGLVCVTGSLALVGDARTALGLRPAERLW